MTSKLMQTIAELPLKDEIWADGEPTGQIDWEMDPEDVPAGTQVCRRSNDDAHSLLDGLIISARETSDKYDDAAMVAVAIMDGLHQDEHADGKRRYYDVAYAASDAGFPGVWSICLELAEAGVAEYGGAWNHDREFVDDIQSIMPVVFGGEFVDYTAEGFRAAWKKLP